MYIHTSHERLRCLVFDFKVNLRDSYVLKTRCLINAFSKMYFPPFS